jgi:hypothetical protein
MNIEDLNSVKEVMSKFEENEQKKVFFDKYFPTVEDVSKYNVLLPSTMESQFENLNVPSWVYFSEHTDDVLAFDNSQTFAEFAMDMKWTMD